MNNEVSIPTTILLKVGSELIVVHITIQVQSLGQNRCILLFYLYLVYQNALHLPYVTQFESQHRKLILPFKKQRGTHINVATII